MPPWYHHFQNDVSAISTYVWLDYRGVVQRFLSLSHWCRVTHICVSDLTSIGSDNGLSPGPRLANIRTNAGILLIRPLGTNFSEFSVEILMCRLRKGGHFVSASMSYTTHLSDGLARLRVWEWIKHNPVHINLPSGLKWDYCDIIKCTESSNCRVRGYFLSLISYITVRRSSIWQLWSTRINKASLF